MADTVIMSEDGGEAVTNLLALHLEELKPENVPELSGPISPAILDDNWMFNCGKWVTTDSYLKEINGLPTSQPYAYEADNKSWEIRSEPLEIINFLDHLKPETITMIQFGDEEKAAEQEAPKIVELEVFEQLMQEIKTGILEELKPDDAPLKSDADSTASPVRPQRRNHVAQPPKGAREGQIVNVNGVLWRDGIVIREVCCEPMEDEVSQAVVVTQEDVIVEVAELKAPAEEEVVKEKEVPSNKQSSDEPIFDEERNATEKEEDKKPSTETTPDQVTSDNVPIDVALDSDSDSGWVFVESGWVNTRAEVAEGKLKESSATPLPDDESRPEAEQMDTSYEEEAVNTSEGKGAKVTESADQPEQQFLDFLQPHTIPSSLDDLLLPVGEFYDATLVEMKPVNTPVLSNRPTESAKLANGWEFSAGMWFNPVAADNESLLDSAGRPVPLRNPEVLSSAVATAEVELLERECPFESEYLSELKPIFPPVSSTDCGQSANSQEIELPAPEVELLAADQFICVMTYDAESQQIVCGMPSQREAVPVVAEAVEVQSEIIDESTDVSINHEDFAQEHLLIVDGATQNTAAKGDEPEQRGVVAEEEMVVVNQSKEDTILQPPESMKVKEEIPENTDSVNQIVDPVEVEVEEKKENDATTVEIEAPKECPLRVNTITIEEVVVPILHTADNTDPVTPKTPPTPSKRYSAPIFEHLLPKTPIPVVKLSDNLGLSASVDVFPNPNTNNRTNESAAAEAPLLADVPLLTDDTSSSDQIAAVTDEIPEEVTPAPVVAVRDEEVMAVAPEVANIEQVPEVEQTAVPGECRDDFLFNYSFSSIH